MRAGHAPGREDASGGRAVAWLGTRAPRLGLAPLALPAPRSLRARTRPRRGPGGRRQLSLRRQPSGSVT